jgi:asparagine synthase (glutamine-hydrolysing)
MCGLLYYSGKDVDLSVLKESQARLRHRGPDSSKLVATSTGVMAFNRLAIMDLTDHGDQPFVFKNTYAVCNGEIYNFLALKAELRDFHFHSDSDCEVLIPLFQNHGIKGLVERLDGEFAFVIFDEGRQELFAARDAMGIRPLFYGYSTISGNIAFGSEAKALLNFCRDIAPVLPGHLYANGKFEKYADLSVISPTETTSFAAAKVGINKLLTAAVHKRLHADAPVGYLLSGGLDSSLVCAIAQKFSKKPIKTFAIGMATDAIDLKYAKQVADYIGSEHTEVIMTKDEAIKSLRDVIYHLESWDITSVRASVGMFAVCKYIHEHTKVKVLLTGEVSDELFGYKYTDFAPSAAEFQLEAGKRIRELYIYDVLRADRCISAHSLEARVPFSDNEFVSFVMGIDPKLKMNTTGQGKYLLRRAFDGDLLPQGILDREKAAFSDAVGHSLVEGIKEYAAASITEAEVKAAGKLYPHGTPISAESLLYRRIFEEFFPGQARWITDFWLPNQKWENCNVQDPSARVLPNYGKSGV